MLKMALICSHMSGRATLVPERTIYMESRRYDFIPASTTRLLLHVLTLEGTVNPRLFSMLSTTMNTSTASPFSLNPSSSHLFNPHALSNAAMVLAFIGLARHSSPRFFIMSLYMRPPVAPVASRYSVTVLRVVIAVKESKS